MTAKPSCVVAAAGLLVFIVATAAYAASATVVDQVRQRFSISVLSIIAGDSIRYANTDDVRHNIHIYGSDGTDVDHGLQNPEQTLEVKFDRPGVFVVRCSIHQKMKMRVEVR